MFLREDVIIAFGKVSGMFEMCLKLWCGLEMVEVVLLSSWKYDIRSLYVAKMYGIDQDSGSDSDQHTLVMTCDFAERISGSFQDMMVLV